MSLREGTQKEFLEVVARAGHPSPRRMFTKRSSDAFYMDRGTDVASHHKTTTRGKVTHESYMINPAYLRGDEDENNKEETK